MLGLTTAQATILAVLTFGAALYIVSAVYLSLRWLVRRVVREGDLTNAN